MKYFKGTRNLELILTGDQIGLITWYVDASFAVYGDCKGHMGGLMTFGHGAVTSFSQKQKLNTKHSTEAELVGVDDALPEVLWTLSLMEG